MAAASLFWSKTGLVFVDGLTYSNVTTADIRWDSNGNVIGDGDETTIVRDFYTGPKTADSIEALSSSLPASVADLVPTSGDGWFVAVKQVMFYLTPCALGGSSGSLSNCSTASLYWYLTSSHESADRMPCSDCRPATYN